MGLKEYFYLIKKKAWLVVLTTIVFMGLSGAVSSFLITPVYEANTTLMVDINQSSDNVGVITGDQLNMTQKLTVIYGEIIKSRSVLDKVSEKLELDISGSDMSDKVSVAQVKDTHMMKISVVDTNPKQAMDIANTIPIVFKEEAKRVVKANDVQVIDKALEPIVPIKPDIAINVSMAGIVGFVSSIGVILLKEYTNNKIKTPEDIKNYLDLFVLGVVPDFKKINSRKNYNEIIDEAYRIIRTKIKFSKSASNIKSILITSSKQNEGKTSVTTSIAKSFAKLDNKRVLIIDADMRNPSIHKIFSVSNNKGLSDVILGIEDINSCIKNSEISQLDILVAGIFIDNPSEILTSNSFSKLVDDLKLIYDYIFIDSPPIGVVADAGLISNFADATIFVVGSNDVEIDLCKLSKERLDYVNSNTLGCILNKFKISEDSYYSYSYSHDNKKYKK
ncbi:MAG: polysaccharide biosynthesis tyrosine autokinase [Paraclostridium sp.]